MSAATLAPRVICSPAVGRFFIADLAIAFGRLHPFLQVSLELESKPFSLTDSEFDVGLCVGMPVQDQAVVSKLGELTSGYVATPYFLQTHGSPATVQSLAALPICDVSSSSVLHERLALTSREGEVVYAPVKLATHDPDVGLRAMLSGELVGRMEHFYCVDHLLDKRLLPVMAELDETRALYTVVSSRKGKPLKVQLFVDFLHGHLAPRLRTLELQVDSIGNAVT